MHGDRVAGTWWGEDIVPRLKCSVVVPYGEIIPAGYGVAWRSFERDATVCILLPFNVIAGTLRSVYVWLRSGYLVSSFSPRYAEAIRWGERRGYAQGLVRGRQKNPYAEWHNREVC